MQQFPGLLEGAPCPVLLVLGVMAVLWTAWGWWLRYRISRQAMKRVDGKNVLDLFEVIHGTDSKSWSGLRCGSQGPGAQRSRGNPLLVRVTPPNGGFVLLSACAFSR
ncbi:hypothetical protein [Streptomyces sp. NPDC059970]|uniref:hypothetical protein n=1 Tax=Streptomyces sp. NPDC059970 TaxID=3347019 RepID=UPI00367B149B